MIGIISKTSDHGHSLFKNFKLALTNYLACELKNVNNVDDLQDVDTLFIIDEHAVPNKEVWMTEQFIQELNEKNIRTIILNIEKIYDSKFPWNLEIQQNVERINNCVQILSEINDVKLKGSPFINRHGISRDTAFNYQKQNQQERILFIGQSEHCYNPSYAYNRRYLVLEELKKRAELPIDIHITDRKLTYEEFLTKMSSYKFILNPLGVGDFLNLRFYEALKLGCIPIQQVTDDMLNSYFELNTNLCATFKSPEEVVIPDQAFKQNAYYLEDLFQDNELVKLI